MASALVASNFAQATQPAVRAFLNVGARVPWQVVLRWTGRAVVAALAGGVVFARAVLERMYASITLLPPTKQQLEHEDLDANPLYRAVPGLRGKLAWRQLGDFPTPVHRFSCVLPGQDCEVEFWVKREDLSSARYGGNKVRTLQYQLASWEARAERSGELGLVALGSGGSNQVVAAKAHAAFLPASAGSVEGLWPMPDEPEMDNTLNLLSALSLRGEQGSFGRGGGRVLAALGLLPAWLGGKAPACVMMPGGHNPLGVLGQTGAALELAEQVAGGELPDPDGIVVALGSCCTAAGLVLGVVLARDRGLPAFRRPGFRIHAQPVHPAIAKMQRLVGFVTSKAWPMTVGRSLREACALIAVHGGPDLTDAALQAMRELLAVSTDSSIIGKYGAHSEASRAAKAAYDGFARPPPGAPHLWLCGHFTAKSFALLLKLLGEVKQRRFVFWQSKSAVQPLGERDEWAAFQEQRRGRASLSKWGVVGGITGHPSAVAASGLSTIGKEVRPVSGPEDYRALMTPLEAVQSTA